MAAALLVLVGFIDAITGAIPDLTVLYLLPVALVTFVFGLKPGLFAAAATLVVEALALPPASRLGAEFAADVIAHGAVFFLAAFALDKLLVQLGELRRLSAQRDFDLRLARDVQGDLLGRDEEPPDGFEVGRKLAFLREIGGDYVHVRTVDDNLLACIGDVSGKGVAAALLTSLLHDAVVSALKTSPDPAAVVVETNRRLFGVMPSEMFVTFFCVEFTGELLRYVNAGHEPPLLAEPGLPPRPLATQDLTPLGIQAIKKTPETGTVPFIGGSVLLAVTDGVVESPSLLGRAEESIAGLLDEARGLPAQQVTDRVYDLAVGDGVQKDDIAILTVRRL